MHFGIWDLPAAAAGAPFAFAGLWRPAPDGDGTIPVVMEERLIQIGDWLKVNGEAVYGAARSPFGEASQAFCTRL